jgi:putative Ca2+/H+ antiporter (TMEM165/GDT1 family)
MFIVWEKGTYKETTKIVKQLIGAEVMWTPNAKNSTFQIVGNKEFFVAHLLANDNKVIVMLFGVELNNVFNKFLC